MSQSPGGAAKLLARPIRSTDYTVRQGKCDRVIDLLSNRHMPIPLHEFLPLPTREPRSENELAWEIAVGRGLVTMAQSGNLLERWNQILSINEGFYGSEGPATHTEGNHPLLQSGRLPKWTTRDKECMERGSLMSLSREGQIDGEKT